MKPSLTSQDHQNPHQHVNDIAIMKNMNALACHYDQLETQFDPIYRSIWCKFLNNSSSVLTITLLENIRVMQNKIANYCFENPLLLPKYLIWTSENEKIFNLGLDLSYIYQLIIEKNESLLNDYIQLCIDVLYINLKKLDIPHLITISLIRGKAYGGGFEAALSSDIVIAESSARCCFPEIRYNLLPSLGTLKMLLRRYPISMFKLSLFEGKTINLEDLMSIGIIDTISEPRNGIKVIQEKIQKINSHHNVYADLYNAKLHNILITYNELDEFKKLWLDAALNLKTDDLKRLSRLAKIQERRV